MGVMAIKNNFHVGIGGFNFEDEFWIWEKFPFQHEVVPEIIHVLSENESSSFSFFGILSLF